jgi:hypothetical protein
LRLPALAVALLVLHSSIAVAADDEAPPPAPNDFAFGMKFDTQGNAAAFRAPLPTDVYRGVTSNELADLAVFNGRGEVVPHVLAPAFDPYVQLSAVLSFPVFPLRGNDRAVMEALRVTVEAGGGKVDLALPDERGPAPAGGNQGLIGGYIVDGRALEGVSVFDLGWADDAPEFAGRLRVEGSDTLGNWRTVVDAAPIANLRAGDARLVERRINVSARAKYWRLTWVGARAPFEITSVNAHTGGTPALRRTSLVLEGRAVPGKPGEFEFDAGGFFPVDHVNLELPELNSVVVARLLTRPLPSKPWRPVSGGDSGFYRLQGTDGELVNGDVRVYSTADRYWLVRADTRRSGMGNTVPKLKIAWPSHDVVFLARGPGPFTLAYGNGALRASAGRIAAIPKGARILDASPGKQQALGGESRLASPSARAPSKSMVLWGVLGLGVAFLGYMAYRLSRELKRS